MARSTALVVIIAFVAAGEIGHACSRGSPVSAAHMIDEADLIVRALAVRYLKEPDLGLFTTGTPESIVIFEVLEVLKGEAGNDPLHFHGYLANHDDYNDHPAPYRFVRPGGRAGSCFANTYKNQAHYLLFLKQSPQGYTVNWDALAPVNEQLRSEQDPWLLWVRGFLAGRDFQRRLPPRPSF
jgi:hypothetical protein